MIEHSKGTNFLSYWEKDSFSRPGILLMKYETLVKSFGLCVAITAPWNSRIQQHLPWGYQQIPDSSAPFPPPVTHTTGFITHINDCI